MRTIVTCKHLTLSTIPEPSTAADATATDATAAVEFCTSASQLDTISLTSGNQLQPSSPELHPFNCPKVADKWAEADQDLAKMVVPAVLSAPSLEEKHHVLCEGIYEYFPSRYGTRTKAKTSRKKKPNGSEEKLQKLKEEKTSAEMNLGRPRDVVGIVNPLGKWLINSTNSFGNTGNFRENYQNHQKQLQHINNEENVPGISAGL